MSALPSTRPRVLATVLLALVFLATAWFYAWTPASYPVKWTSPTAEGYYAELTDAFLHGHLYLKRRPSLGLTSLADPYDPALNAAHRVNDLSYFRNRYYLYHGPAPALTLLVPFRLVSGQYLTDAASTLILCLGGAGLSLLLLAEIRRRFAPGATLLSLGTCAIAIVLCHGYYLVLRNPGVNHVVIASAYFYLLLSFWGTVRALTSSGRTWPWLLLAATSYGLAIASRPNYVFGVVAFAAPLVFLTRRDGPRTLRLNLAGIAAPLVAIVGAMLLYNYLRFGQLLEFGQRYMLGGWDQRELGFLGLRNLGVNAWYYLLAPGNLGADFPFLTAPGWQAVGALFQTPFLWLGLIAGLFCLLLPAGQKSENVRPLAGMVGLVVLANLGLLLLLPSGNDRLVQTSANARYSFDFLPAMVLLACIGVLRLDHLLANRPWAGRAWRSGTAAAILLSLLGALSLDLQPLPAESYRPLAQFLNRPVNLAQQWLGAVYGPVKLEVIFPADKPHQYEPLISTGTDAASDLLYVFYDGPGTIRFGLVGSAMVGPLSPPIPVTYGQPHQIEISMGSLYPAGGNPVLNALSDAEVGHLKRTLRIVLDGQIVYDAPAHFFPSKPRHVSLGVASHVFGYSQSEFSGQILASSRLPISALAANQIDGPEFGPIRLVTRFPSNKTGVSEPLVVTGIPNAGDFFYVHYESNWQLSLGLDHWGHKGLRTALLPVDYSVNHVIEIHLGSLLPPVGHVFYAGLSPAAVARLKNQVRVVLDGEVVLESDMATFDASPYDVNIGRNPIGGSTCVYDFSGEIKSATRLPLPPGTTP